MFGLLHNLCKYVQKKRERKITIVLMGLDNAGKTTVLNMLRGNLHADATPTYGFSSQTIMQSGHKLDIYDLGGGKNIRRIWKTYLAEVHGAIYIVDAADPARFPESQAALSQVLSEPQLQGKPILVLANKQDLPTAAQAHEVATALSLHTARSNQFNILACSAKTADERPPDIRIRDGIRWLVSVIDSMFPALNPRVQQEAAEAKQQEEQRKRDREERARQAKEERLRQQKQAEAAEAAAISGNMNKSVLIKACTSNEATVLQPGMVPPLPCDVISVQQATIQLNITPRTLQHDPELGVAAPGMICSTTPEPGQQPGQALDSLSKHDSESSQQPVARKTSKSFLSFPSSSNRIQPLTPPPPTAN
eukprot:jgi/Chrzof1/14211/Cz08g29190.t1